MRSFDNRIERGQQDKPDAMAWESFTAGILARLAGTMRATSVKEVRIALETFGELCEPGSPRTVDQRMAKRFIQRAVETGRSESTVNKHLSSLRRVWNGEFPNHPNPFKSTRSERQGGVRRFKVAEKDWHRTTPDELQALLKKCDHRWKAMILLAYTTGLREAELLNLIWRDIDLDAMTVSVNPKLGTDTTWTWAPKDHERRVLPLTPETKLSLMRLDRADGVPYLFVPPDRYARIRGDRDRARAPREVLNGFLRQYHVRCRWAKVPEDDFHSLRKTCITNWLEAGVPVHEVQRMAGHSSPETTVKFYAKVDRSAIDRARAASVAYTKAVGHAG